MFKLLSLSVALFVLPLPEKLLPERGMLVPVSVRVAESAGDDAVLSERVARLRRAVCEQARHVRLVEDPAAAAVPFEIETYEITPLGAHHVSGRFYQQGKWEPFKSWSSGVGEHPLAPGLGRFVETFIFDSNALERERLTERDARGRPVPRNPADVARCMAGQ